jgi:hypothetical protein
MKMTRPGQPFNHDHHDHISLKDFRAGMELQVDGGWNADIFEPWSICTVQQADDGRLYVEGKDGSPKFLIDFSEEQDPDNDFIWGMFYVPLDKPEERLFTLDDDGNLTVVRGPVRQ